MCDISSRLQLESVLRNGITELNGILIKGTSFTLPSIPSLILFSFFCETQNEVSGRVALFQSTKNGVDFYCQAPNRLKAHYKSVKTVVYMTCALYFKSFEAIQYIYLRNGIKQKQFLTDNLSPFMFYKK